MTTRLKTCSHVIVILHLAHLTFHFVERDDRVGNFPLRMLVIMVKLFKVLDHKKSLVLNLQWMNDRAERMNMVVSGYPRVFQERYAEILAELDIANRLLESYLNGIAEYNELLVTNLNDPVPADRPDQLRKQAQAHARQLVKHCNHALQVKNPTALDVISRLTSIMLQVSVEVWIEMRCERHSMILAQ